jgi:tetratricopeptide (TPR) repeat protein
MSIASSAKIDPDSAKWQRDLAPSHERIGDVLFSQGNLTEALQSYRAALEIGERLAKTDPSNADWQHGLALSLGRIGRVLARQGAHTEAQAAFIRAREMIVSLMQQRPENVALPRGLAWLEAELAESNKVNAAYGTSGGYSAEGKKRDTPQ